MTFKYNAYIPLNDEVFFFSCGLTNSFKKTYMNSAKLDRNKDLTIWVVARGAGDHRTQNQ